MTPSLSAIIRRGGPLDDLEACVRALAEDAGEHRLELLVVGPETPGGRPAAELPGLRRIGGDEPDPATELNRAAAAAVGDILLFLAADAIALPGLVRRLVELHTGAAELVGIGEVSPAAGSHPLATARYRREPGAEEADLSAYAGQVLSVRAQSFRRAGGFNPGLSWGGDVELLHRLRELGIALRPLDAPAARRARPMDAGRVIQERIAAGRGSVELYRRTPALLPGLELGAFHAGSPPGLTLRRLLLALGGPRVPVALGGLLPSREWRRRWLRFQHEYHFWRGARAALGRTEQWRALLRPPVILMYHAIGWRGERAGGYIVPLDRFRRQLRWLRLRGYRILGLDDLLRCRRTHQAPPARSVVITFDDGYLDNRELAAAELQSLGLNATFFLVSDSLGGRNSWDARGELAGRWMLSWEDARAMLDAGLSVGAHTRTHPVLPDLTPRAQRDELAGAREDLERGLGRPVTTFAYPFGRLNEATVAAVAECGYEGACCSRSGVNDPAVPSLRLRRVEVRGTDSIFRFALAVHRGWTPRRRTR